MDSKETLTQSQTTSQSDNDIPQEGDEASLQNYITSEIPTSEIASLELAQQSAPLFTLFKELVRSTMDDYFVKMAMLLHLSGDREKVKWTPQEMAAEFYWLQETPRKRITHQLSKSGWLEYDEGVYRISSFGKAILALLSSLPKQDKIEHSLGANVPALEVAEHHKQDPSSALRMFINELVRVDEDIVNTLLSRSEFLIRKLNSQVRSQFDIAIKSREHLEGLNTKTFNSYRLKQQAHEKLSSFHSRVSQVQRAQNDLVARKIILADQSLTQHDIDSFLINSTVKELAQLGKKFISHPIVVPDLIPTLMVYETEWQFEKEMAAETKRGWTEVEVAGEDQDNLMSNSQLFNLVTEIEHNLEKKGSFAIEKFVPTDNWGISGFRFSMLSAFESSALPPVPGMEDIKCNKLSVTYPESQGVELPVAYLNDHLTGVKEITKGIVTKAEEAKDESNATK